MKHIICGAAFLTALILIYGDGFACQVDQFYLTKEGTLAASTPKQLQEANGCRDKACQEKLSSMMETGAVLKLKENVKVHVTERSFEYRMLKILLPDNANPYWVNDGTLEPITCENK